MGVKMTKDKMLDWVKENFKFVLFLAIMVITIIILMIVLLINPQEPLYCTVNSYFNNDGNQSVVLKVNASGKDVKIRTSTGQLINSNYYEETVRENGIYKYEVISGDKASSCSTSVTTIKNESMQVITASKSDDNAIKINLNDRNDLSTDLYSWNKNTWSKNISKDYNKTGNYKAYVKYSNGTIKEISFNINSINEKYAFNSINKLKVNSNEYVTWNSTNQSIASVDSNGNVYSKKVGYVVITASTKNDIYIWGIEVLPKATSIELNKNDIKMEINKTADLKIVKIEPKTAICNKIEWSSEDEDVAIVNEGIVTAKSNGKTIVSVFCDGIEAKVNIKVEPALTFTAEEMNQVKNMVTNSKVSKVQVAVINNGKVEHSYAYNCNENDTFYVSSLSKTVLGITAAKMEQDGIIDLDTTIDTYWYKLKNANFNEYSSAWKSSMGSESTLRDYTAKKLLQNPATLRNALTHSSTIRNGYMVHMVPNDPTSEYFEGSLSKTYSRAAFMLSHTSSQLFEKGIVPGTTTSYDYLGDKLTREHALAGFSMQIAMKESINEYMQKNLFNSLGITNAHFKNGNSIYFAAGYQSSALDLAKIVSLLANDGEYNGNQILSKNAMAELEKVENNLANQSIAFTYVNNRFVRYGNFSKFAGAYNYDLTLLSDYYSYASYDPKTGHGLVITTYGNKDKAKSLVDDISNYVYMNS